MADRPAVKTRGLTRAQLATFLKSHQLIKAFEDLSNDVGLTLPDAIEALSSSMGRPILIQMGDGEDGEDGIGVPGAPGATGADGPAGPAFFAADGEDGADGISMPGTPGAAGAAGAAGAPGAVIWPSDGEDGEPGMPGPAGTGTAGATGATGAAGATIPPSDGEDGQDGFGAFGDVGLALGAYPNPSFTIDQKGRIVIIANKVESFIASIPGSFGTFVGAMRLYPPHNVTLTSVRVDLGSTPLAPAIFNVRKNGVAIFTSPKPTVAVGAYNSTPIPISVALTTADYLTVDVEAAYGSDATVRIDYT